jgi:hypothetical protein
MNYATFGTTIKLTIIGIWGHDAYTNNYTFSGAKGHYPNSIYRFTMFGDGSILKDLFNDIEISESNFKVGYAGINWRIDEINQTPKQPTER